MSGYSDDRRFYLDHMHQNALLARLFITGLTFDAFVADMKARYACERAIMNVSEAARDLERAGKAQDPSFDLRAVSDRIDWRAVKAIGNVLRHDYEEVRAELVWRTVTEYLPELETEAADALKKLSAFYE